MAFDKLQKLIHSVETFNDAAFYSLGPDGESVIIQNENDESLWQVPVSVEEEAFLFDGESAICVQEAEKTEEEVFQDNSESLKDSIAAIFEDVDAGVEAVREHFKTLPNYEPTAENIAENAYSLPSEGKISAVSSIFKKFGEKVERYEREIADFEAYGNFFENGAPRSEKVLDPTFLLEMYEAKQESKDKYFESLASLVEFNSEVKETFSETAAQYIVENFKPTNNIKLEIPKLLVRAKQLDREINVVDDAGVLSEIVENTLGDGSEVNAIMEAGAGGDSMVPNPFVDNMIDAHPRLRFLKFGQGQIFSPSDAEELEREFNYVMSRSHYDLTAEETMFVSNLRHRVMYMNRTRQFDDEVLAEAIKEFNEYFGVRPSGYRDSDRQVGWKDEKEAEIKHVQGVGERVH